MYREIQKYVTADKDSTSRLEKYLLTKLDKSKMLCYDMKILEILNKIVTFVRKKKHMIV